MHSCSTPYQLHMIANTADPVAPLHRFLETEYGRKHRRGHDHPSPSDKPRTAQSALSAETILKTLPFPLPSDPECLNPLAGVPSAGQYPGSSCPSRARASLSCRPLKRSSRWQIPRLFPARTTRSDYLSTFITRRDEMKTNSKKSSRTGPATWPPIWIRAPPHWSLNASVLRGEPNKGVQELPMSSDSVC